MKTQVKFGIDGKQKERGTLTQRLVGFVRAVHKNTQQTDDSTLYDRRELLREYDVYAEQKNAEAIIFAQRRQLAIQ